VLAADGASGTWLAQQLARLDGGPAQDSAEGLAKRIRAFQMAQGLRPDGLPGPLTLMRLNHATGVAEPTLAGARRSPRSPADPAQPAGQASRRRLSKARAWPVIGSVKASRRASNCSGRLKSGAWPGAGSGCSTG
jgi:peptidoglycan hydrolase-like protein with peptidoglycan-binding domain